MLALEFKGGILRPMARIASPLRERTAREDRLSKGCFRDRQFQGNEWFVAALVPGKRHRNVGDAGIASIPGPPQAKLFDAASIFVFKTAPFRVRGTHMSAEFTIPARDAQAYSLMRTYGITDDELNVFISTMLGEIKILSEYAKLPGVANHVKAAIAELEAAEVSRAR